VPDEKEQAVQKAGDSDATEAPAVANLAPPVGGDKCSCDGTKCGYSEKTNLKPRHWTKNVEGVCAIALILITWYYTRAAYRQARASEGAARAAKDAVKVAADTLCETQRSGLIQEELSDANRRSAEKLAADSLNATIANSNLDQRAWVSVIGIQGTPAIGQPWVITLFAKNTGKTFAKHFSFTAVEEGRVDRKTPDFNRDRRPKAESISLLAPNGEYVSKNVVSGEGSVPFRTNPDQSSLDNIKSGYYVQFAYGRMRYQDIFGQWHWTTYCFKLNRQIAWENCHEHNDADENGQVHKFFSTPKPLVPDLKIPAPCPVPSAN
jgi:hypothetical protein